MTAAARITLDDMNRVAKAVRRAGFDNPRFIFRLDKGEIEVIVGDSAGVAPRVGMPQSRISAGWLVANCRDAATHSQRVPRTMANL